jgi:hypothetical protein
MRESARNKTAAERLYRQAAATGSTLGREALAVWWEKTGNHAGADQIAERAAESGNARIRNRLQRMREQRSQGQPADGG